MRRCPASPGGPTPSPSPPGTHGRGWRSARRRVGVELQRLACERIGHTDRMTDAAPTVIVSRRVRAGPRGRLPVLERAPAGCGGVVSGPCQLRGPGAERGPSRRVDRRLSLRHPGAISTGGSHSDERRELMDEGADPARGAHPRAARRRPGPLDPRGHRRGLRTHRSRPARSLRRAQAEIVRRMQSFPGFLRCESSSPFPACRTTTSSCSSFSTRDDLDRWLRSDDTPRGVADPRSPRRRPTHAQRRRRLRRMVHRIRRRTTAVEAGRRRAHRAVPDHVDPGLAPADPGSRCPLGPGVVRLQRGRHRPAHLGADAAYHRLARPVAATSGHGS